MSREDMAASRECYILKVATDRRVDEEGEIVSRARELWVKHYGHAKKGPNLKVMRNKGIAQPRRLSTLADGSVTESQFLNERRVALSKAVQAADDVSHDDELARAAWTESHREVEQKQLLIQRKRKVEESALGNLLPEECDSELENDVDHDKKRRKVNDSKMLHKAAKKEAAVGKRVDLRAVCEGKKVFIETELRNDGQLMAAVRRSFDVVDNRLDAFVFVTPDVANPGTRTKWACIVMGGFLVSAGYFKSSGPFIKYDDATKVHKEIWMSPAAREKHDEIWTILCAAVAVKGSKWKLIDSMGKWIERYNAAFKSHRGPNIIAILSKKETKDARPPVCMYTHSDTHNAPTHTHGRTHRHRY